MRLVAALVCMLATSCAAPVDPDVIAGDSGHGHGDASVADVAVDTASPGPSTDTRPSDTGSPAVVDAGSDGKIDSAIDPADTADAATAADTDVPDFGTVDDTATGPVDTGGGILSCSKDSDCTISPLTCCDLTKKKCGVGAFPLCVSPF